MHGKMSESGEANGESGVNDQSTQDVDTLQTKCLKNGGKQTESPVKEKIIKSLRASFKVVSPLTSKSKRPEDSNNNSNQISDSQEPKSPSLSIGSQSEKPSLTRSMSDSAGNLTQSLVKRGEKFRQSLVHKINKQQHLELVTEVLPEESRPEDVDVVEEEHKETYSLPEIPTMPLSVMEINKLIETDLLEDSYVNLLSMRLELQKEHQALDKEDSPMELVHKEKDLQLLYRKLKGKISNIVRSSNSGNKDLLVYVAYIIMEEEKRQEELGALPGWREAWRDAAKEGVRDTLKKVHMDKPEENTSWLAVHLGLLGKAIEYDLKTVKEELQNSYPLDFKVFETYVCCHHEVIKEHLKSLVEQVTELKDYYALLDFIIHRFPSEKIMGSSALQPEMKEEWKTLPLDKDFLNQIKEKYCSRLQTDMRASLDRIIKLENEEMWENKCEPIIDEELYSSHIDMDIWTNVKGHVQGSQRIDVNLEQKVVWSCLEELKLFPKRFETAFFRWSSPLSSSLTSLWTAYHISYINSFSALKEHMEDYKDCCPNQLELLNKEIDGLTCRLTQTMMEHFQTDVMPFLRRQMTKKWISFDEDFSQLIQKIKSLSDQIKYMSPKNKQTFVNEAHFFVVKEYISQLMKNNYSCKNHKNETAASKISSQWTEIKGLFQEMNSTLVWLHPVGDQLSKIVGCKKREIKNNLQPLVETYPDIRKSHLSAVLFFRGVIRGRERLIILQRLIDLKQNNDGNKKQILFTEIQAAVNTDCLAGAPFMCISFFDPDS